MSDERLLGDHADCPITPEQAYDARFWRMRAIHARNKALTTGSPSNTYLLKLADEADLLAERAALMASEIARADMN